MDATHGRDASEGFMVPAHIMRSGVFAELTGSATKVLIALCWSSADHGSEVFMRREQLGLMTDLCQRSIQRSLNELAKLGLISVKKGTGRRWRRGYRVEFSEDVA